VSEPHDAIESLTKGLASAGRRARDRNVPISNRRAASTDRGIGRFTCSHMLDRMRARLLASEFAGSLALVLLPRPAGCPGVRPPRPWSALIKGAGGPAGGHRGTFRKIRQYRGRERVERANFLRPLNTRKK
jgi:hypothetical protein